MTMTPIDEPAALLAGIRVIEVALLSGSALGGHLAELGADVIKVESGSGDYVRSILKRRGQSTSDMHQLWNRGKRSVEIDLDTECGRESFVRMVRDVDVVIEGRRPGYLQRRGLGYNDLVKVNPRLVFTCLSGFGDSGPYRDYPSHGPAFDAFSGLARPQLDSLGRPRLPGSNYQPMGVLTASLYAAMATTAALLHARESGRSTYLDIAHADASVYARALDVAKWLEDERLGGQGASDDQGDQDQDFFERSVLVQYYKTSEGKHVLFQAMERKFFERFCAAVGRPDLAEAFPRDSEVDWLRGRDDIRSELAALFDQHTSEYWLDFCHQHGVPCTPANIDAELLTDPHFRDRARWAEGETGEPTVLGLPVHAVPPLPPVRRAPRQGEHTDEVMAEDRSSGGLCKGLDTTGGQ